MKLNYPQKQNGMYVLSNDNMDEIAEAFLQEYMPKIALFPEAIDIDWLAEECLYLDVKHKSLTHDGSVLAMLAFEDVEDLPCLNELLQDATICVPKGTVIIDSWLSAIDQKYRRRFTLAHEVAHWILHRSYHSPFNQEYQFRTRRTPYIACRTAGIEAKDSKLETDYDWLEWQADCLAAAILMPKKVFTDITNDILVSCGLYRFRVGQISNADAYVIDKLSTTFCVSRKATEIRLKKLGYILV